MTHHPRRARGDQPDLPRPGEPGGTVDPGYRLQIDVAEDGTVRLRSRYDKPTTVELLQQITDLYRQALAAEIAGLQ